jgi:SnoaL-like domain
VVIPATVTSLLGDRLPPHVAGYYSDLDSDGPVAPAGHFAGDVLYAIPPNGGIETDARRVITGHEALVGWFAERGSASHTHHVQLCIRHGSSCLVEGVTVDRASGSPLGTFAASMQLGDDGLITRYLAFATSPAVQPPPIGAPAARPGAAVVLRRYFDALDSGDFERAAEQFGPDVVYSHPPYRHTGLDGDERVVFRGTAELLAAFRARGKQSFGHRLIAIGQRGGECMLEGIVEGLPDGRDGSFVSSLSLDDEGRIARYVSFYCEPAVRRAGRRT